jgi:hypothetical protein
MPIDSIRSCERAQSTGVAATGTADKSAGVRGCPRDRSRAANNCVVRYRAVGLFGMCPQGGVVLGAWCGRLTSAAVAVVRLQCTIAIVSSA